MDTKPNVIAVTPADYVQWKNHPVSRLLLLKCREETIKAQIAITQKGNFINRDSDSYSRWIAEIYGYIDAFKQISDFKIEENLTFEEYDV